MLSSTNIPVLPIIRKDVWKLLKANIELILEDFIDLINCCLEKRIFPAELKIADVSPIFEKSNSLDKKNCKPDGIISTSVKSLLNKCIHTDSQLYGPKVLVLLMKF